MDRSGEDVWDTIPLNNWKFTDLNVLKDDDRIMFQALLSEKYDSSA